VLRSNWRTIIIKEKDFSDCVVLDKDAFDPDAVFPDEVHDEVLPQLSLAIDELKNTGKHAGEALRMRPGEAAAKAVQATRSIELATFDSDQYDDGGLKLSLWRKIRNYFAF
jgi:hypothetical protein